MRIRVEETTHNHNITECALMKTFQKIALVSAIAAAPFAAQAGLVSIEDAEMSNVTGQAGVTVDITIGGTGISVGEIEYTDEGSVSIQNLTINNVNNLSQTIDVDAEGNLLMGTTEVTDVQLAIGNSGADTTQFSAVALRSDSGETTELVNNVKLNIDLGESTTQIMNLSAAGNALAAAAVTDGFDDANAFAGSVAIRSTSSFEITDLDVGLFGYTAAQSAAKVGITAMLNADGTADAGLATLTTNLTAVTNASGAGYTLYQAAAGNLAVNAAVETTYAADGTVTVTEVVGGADVTASNADAIAVNANAADAGAVKQATGAVQYANGSAIGLTDVRFYGTGGIGTKASMDQVIWAIGGDSTEAGSEAGVYIQMGAIQGTLDIGGIELGGHSIGKVKVSNINLAGMTQRIYGHP
jgi:hypothetical protein